MLPVVTKLLIQRQLRFEAGHLILLGQRICMMPIHTIGRIQFELKKYGAENIIYHTTKESGFDWWSGMTKTFKTTKIGEMLDWGVKIMSLAGWGNLTITKIDIENKEIFYTLENSSVANYLGKTGEAEDHIFRGYLAGSNKYFFGVESEAIETKCASKGDPRCVIVTKPKGKFDIKNPEVKKQLALPLLGKQGKYRK